MELEIREMPVGDLQFRGLFKTEAKRIYPEYYLFLGEECYKVQRQPFERGIEIICAGPAGFLTHAEKRHSPIPVWGEMAAHQRWMLLWEGKCIFELRDDTSGPAFVTDNMLVYKELRKERLKGLLSKMKTEVITEAVEQGKTNPKAAELRLRAMLEEIENTAIGLIQ